jgi:DNA-binding FrmR family transcriptional regulator
MSSLYREIIYTNEKIEEISMNDHHKPSYKDIIQLMKTAEGQLRAIKTMYEDGRYCVDISKQVLALQALLKKANNLILKDHLQTCVYEAISQQKPEEKIVELADIMDLIQS